MGNNRKNKLKVNVMIQKIKLRQTIKKCCVNSETTGNKRYTH